MYLHENQNLFANPIARLIDDYGMYAEAIEKDYYITLILKELSERLPYIVFKGGTSLSKCHKVINRFSEDIDIAVDINLSQGKKKKLKYTLVDIADELGLTILNLDSTRSRRDCNRYEIAYKPLVLNTASSIAPLILLETSYTAISFPTTTLPVSCAIGEYICSKSPQQAAQYGLQPFHMKVQELNRTLADKVFAVCDYYLQKRIRKHSRHIYDIYKLYPLVPQDDFFKALVAQVRAARKLSNICPSAQDGVDVPTLLQIIIQEHAYEEDYHALTEKLLGENIDYATAITALEKIARSDIFATNIPFAA